jgi:2-C-methyl-D-erythritol 4-phosphate cytidylyltransferase
MSVAVVLLAAGRGERLGGDLPKAFVELAGRSLLSHALDTVRACAVDEIVLTLPEGFEDAARELTGKDAHLLPGGGTRQESVAAAVRVLREEVPAAETILVHDVARPLASVALFEAVRAAVGRADGAVPAVQVADTVKRVVDDVVVETLPREELVAVQTPQGFRAEALERAHIVAAREAFTGTDDAMLLERIGCRVVAVPGEPRNVKITTPEDLLLAAALLESSS